MPRPWASAAGALPPLEMGSAALTLHILRIYSVYCKEFPVQTSPSAFSVTCQPCVKAKGQGIKSRWPGPAIVQSCRYQPKLTDPNTVKTPSRVEKVKILIRFLRCQIPQSLIGTPFDYFKRKSSYCVFIHLSLPTSLCSRYYHPCFRNGDTETQSCRICPRHQLVRVEPGLQTQGVLRG